MKNERDFIFPACRQKTAIWFSTPLAGPSDSAEKYSHISCGRNIVPQDTEVTFQRDPSDQQIIYWKGRQWQKQAHGDQMDGVSIRGTAAGDVRQLSGMASVWQIPAWAPLLVPVLDCHTNFALASPSWGKSYQATQGLWPCEDMNVPQVLISTTHLDTDLQQYKRGCDTKVATGRPIPRENLILTSRSGMPVLLTF